MNKVHVRGLRLVLFNLVFLLVLAGCGGPDTSPGEGGAVTLNLGYFPNLTHAVALVGVGQNIFQKDLGADVHLQKKTFNAGPAEIQALLAGSLDLAFVGPSPAISGYTASHGTALKVIAGASSAGVAFVVQANARINGPPDLAGKTIADPQRGGTQDIALRNYLAQNHLKSADEGGNVRIISTDNSNILTLFKTGRIDGAWMPEPWATRLVVEGKGRVFLNESTLWPNGRFATTIVVVRQAFLRAYPDVVRRFLQAVVETVQYIGSNPASAEQIANAQIRQITGTATRTDELPLAFRDLQVTYDPLAATINEQADRSFALGFVRSKPDLANFFNLGPLNAVLSSKGLATVATS